MRWASAAGAGIMGVVVGWPAVRAFLSPAFRPPPQPQWIKIGEVEQMELGVAARFDFAEMINDAWVESRVLRGVWVYTEDGERFTVYNARCTHLGCGYAFDKTRNLFQCPCHHGLFDLKTGRVLDGPPPRPLDTLETKVEDGLLYVAFRDFREGVPEKIPVS